MGCGIMISSAPAMGCILSVKLLTISVAPMYVSSSKYIVVVAYE